jgi:hypothetical protein
MIRMIQILDQILLQFKPFIRNSFQRDEEQEPSWRSLQDIRHITELKWMQISGFVMGGDFEGGGDADFFFW